MRLNSYSDKEILAMLLGGGQPISRAATLLDNFGSLRCVLAADHALLSQQSGIGRTSVLRLQSIPELARRFYAESLPAGTSIKNPTETATFLQARLRHLPHELFCCLYLDNRHRVLAFDELFRGTIDGTSVYPREVVKAALAANAAAVILAHNHPSGVAEPSQADERITKRLKSALELVDIRVLDHLVVGDGQTTSLAQRGVI